MNIIYSLLFLIPGWLIKCVMTLPIVIAVFVFVWLLRLVILPMAGLWLTAGCWVVSALLVVSCVATCCIALRRREIEV